MVKIHQVIEMVDIAGIIRDYRVRRSLAAFDDFSSSDVFILFPEFEIFKIALAT